MSGKQFKVRGIARDAKLALSAAGDEMIVIQFEILEGDYEGSHRRWHGMFTDDDKIERTLDSMRACGWTGDDITELSTIGSKECVLVCEDEFYNGKTYAKIIFVNGTGRLEVRTPLAGGRLKSFAAKMKSKIGGTKAPAGAAKQQRQREPGDDDDDIPM